jgi:hypothetical protein
MNEQTSEEDVYAIPGARIYLSAVIDAINRNDVSALDQFLAEQLIDHNPIPGQSPGRVGFKEWMASARTSFPDCMGRSKT